MKSKFIFYKVEARNFETGKYHRDELICFILDEDTKAPQEIVLSTSNPFFFFLLYTYPPVVCELVVYFICSYRIWW